MINVKWLEKVLSSGMKVHEKIVLLYVLREAKEQENGLIFNSGIVRLRDMSRISFKRIGQALNTLIAMGVLTILRGRNGRQNMSTTYFVNSSFFQ